MKESTKAALWRAFLILAGLGFIEVSVRLGWIDPFFLASPLQAIGVLWSQLVSGNALYLILVTLYEIAAALVISTVVGLLVGFVLWRYQLIGASYEILLAALFSSPVILAYRMFRHILLPAAAPTIFSGFRLGLTYILKSVLGLEYVVQVGGVGMWISDAAFRFEVGEVYAGLVGTTLLSILFLFMINHAEMKVRK